MNAHGLGADESVSNRMTCELGRVWQIYSMSIWRGKFNYYKQYSLDSFSFRKLQTIRQIHLYPPPGFHVYFTGQNQIRINLIYLYSV